MDLHLTDGHTEKVITLNRAHNGVLIPPGVWDSMHNFSSGTVLLVVCSEYYDEDDYIRDYPRFLEYVEQNYFSS